MILSRRMLLLFVGLVFVGYHADWDKQLVLLKKLNYLDLITYQQSAFSSSISRGVQVLESWRTGNWIGPAAYQFLVGAVRKISFNIVTSSQVILVYIGIVAITKTYINQYGTKKVQSLFLKCLWSSHLVMLTRTSLVKQWLKGFVLSHILRPLLHAGEPMRQLDIPDHPRVMLKVIRQCVPWRKRVKVLWFLVPMA